MPASLRSTLLVALGCSATAPCTVLAQSSYPSGPVRIVVATSPSGLADTYTRRVGQKLAQQMKVPVIVENKPGANGNIGSEFVARARPDGLTLLTSSVNQVLNVALGEPVGYDLLNDFQPVTVTIYSPNVLAVNPEVPAASVAQFIAHVRANPDKLSYGSPGVGNINHLAGLLFLQSQGLAAVHVPYKGGAPMRIDLVSGRLQFATQSVTVTAPDVQAKKLRGLAIAAPRRSPLLPDVPTMAEAGVRDYEVGVWYGFAVPSKTPAAIVNRLHAEIGKAMQEADIRQQLANEGIDTVNYPPAEAAAYVRAELARWSRVIKAADIKPQI